MRALCYPHSGRLPAVRPRLQEKPLREKSAKCFISIIFDPQHNRDFTLIEKQRKRGTNRMLLRLGAYGHINTRIWTAT